MPHVIQVHAPEGGGGSVWPLVLQHLIQYGTTQEVGATLASTEEAGQEANSRDGSPPKTSDLFPSAPSDEFYDVYSDACYDTDAP